ncbi:cell surface protein [Bacteroides sp. AN502(2024)]|uniref:cell surface protein n=1 Tax=Bacteroides sp. AN502(2024) TaxID=3160599 RepID=UPI0035181E1E
MNKKYLSVVLFGALLAASAGTFTSCKDYDDDIKGLQERIDGNQSSVAALEKQLATLDAAAKAAQTAADNAKTAAEAAQAEAEAAKAVGDQAAAEAAQAKRDAQAAQVAANNAKVEAIEEAKKQVEALKVLLQESINGKVDVEVFEAAQTAIGGKIAGIEERLNNLDPDQVAEDMRDAKQAIATLMAAYENLKIQEATLNEYKEACLDYTANAEAIKKAVEDIGTAQTEIEKLWNEINGEGGLKELIGGNTTAISNLTTQTAKDIENLENRINGQLTDIKDDIKDNIKPAILAIQNQIRDEIKPDLDQLHILVVARLSSITFAPDYIVDGVEAIKFSSLKYGAMDKSENAAIPTTYKFSTAALATASYHFNPASFKLANADYSYIDRTVTVVNTRAAASKWVEISGEPVANAEKGTVDFKLLRLNAHSTQPEKSDVNMIALQATLKGDAVDKKETGAVVTSPYVSVYDEVLDASDVRIADDATLTEFGADAHYATTFDACKEEEPRYKMYYNEVFDLKDLVATCFGDNEETNIHRKFPIEDYNLSYRFAVASSEYKISTGGTITDQQKNILCNDAEEGLFQAKDFSREAIGRTPIFKVELVDADGNVVRRGFVKVAIGVAKSDDMILPMSCGTLTYECASTTAKYEISEEYIIENLYRKIANSLGEVGMSHEEFWNLYDVSAATTIVTKNGQAYAMSSVPQIVDGPTAAGVATKKIVWSFKHSELGKIGNTSAFVASITVKNKLASSEYPAAVTFKFTLEVKLPAFTETLTKNEIYWTLNNISDDFDVNVTVPNKIDEAAENCQFSQDLKVAYKTHKVEGLPECVTDYYQITETKSNGKATATVLSGVKINGTVISLDKNDAAVQKALNSEGGLQAVVKHVYRLESDDELSQHSFVVNFIRPVNLNMPSGMSLQDAKTGGDIANFQHNNLLTDWRGEAITAPGSELVTESKSYWNYKYTPKYEYVDGHYVQTQEAKLNVKTEEVSFIATKPVTMYNVKATYTYSLWVGGTEATAGYQEKARETFEGNGETMSDAMMQIEAQVTAKKATDWKMYTYAIVKQEGEPVVTTSVVPKDEEVKYTYVSGIEYTPAKYEWIDGTWEEVKHDHSDMPDFAGSKDGETAGCGCYVWITETSQTTQPIPGQFWDFYGPFGDVKLDVTKATTDLSDGKLPSGATLVQEGNTVKYVNVHSPVGSEYKIFIPATVNYGWGTATSQLTIVVKPVKK